MPPLPGSDVFLIGALQLSASEGVAHLQQDHPDILLLDLHLGGVDGLQILKNLRESQENILVIIMTAYGSSDVQKEANRRGSLFYIGKPFEINDIRKIIIDLIGKKKGFRGKGVGLQLTDVIQMNCLSRLTTSLTVTRDGEKGVIYLNEGEVIHAECGDHKGTEAFYQILSWQEGEFIYNIGVIPTMQTIYQNWEHLLVEAMRRNDEKA